MSYATRQKELGSQIGNSSEMIGDAAEQRRRAVVGTTARIPDEPVPGNLTMMKAFVGTSLVLWLGAVVFLGGRGEFVAPPGTAPYPIALGFALPLIVFFAAF